MNPSLEFFLWKVGFLFPLMLVALGGIAWAIVNWKRAFHAALATTIACTVLLLSTCILPAMEIWVPRLMQARLIVWTSRGVEVCSSSCLALCIAVLIFAAFAGRAAIPADDQRGRDSKRNRRNEDDDDDYD